MAMIRNAAVSLLLLFTKRTVAPPPPVTGDLDFSNAANSMYICSVVF